MKKLVIIGACVVLGIAVLYGVATYNSLAGQEQAVAGSWAQVQNVFQRRADLVPNLVATVSGAANFEKSTMVAVTEARASVGRVQLGANQVPNAQQMESFQKAQDGLSSALSRLLVVSESYPQLRATEGFRDLQVQLEGTENRISVERARFNSETQIYNAHTHYLFAGIIARLGGFQPKPYFQAAPESQTAPKVQF